ncbi:polysaccharide deacetylase family protein [Kangiella sediminilitoris]|uniref:Putative xylanase/chitin deacetylase n=1 Tax=Kangiella sediminilitoris TaxID=1144748 RepID=A0A1B3BBJ4_9GAMM|nr:polysaccharide deacetylase family protein [Kangiella sediminilitoris]AOE50159.1 Putative xylanase/chitin deacetylase [Kangiella sediminilitoris]
MKTLITLDYELFFGSHSGTAESCMLKPTNKLLELLDKHDVKATFYVDIGYLSRADELKCDQASTDAVKEQLRNLSEQGHDLQLHIHPHWEKAKWDNGYWSFDLSYYKLSDFTEKKASEIVLKYANKLESVAKVRANSYRAGGWCIQPFEHFSSALFQAGIKVDSTVFTDGVNLSEVQGFDFRGSPRLSHWKFQEDPLIPNKEGPFTELPISSSIVSPLFFWRFALIKKFAGIKYKAFGDGTAAKMSGAQLKRLLTKKSRTVASIDGYKSILLDKFRKDAFREYGDSANLVLIGHPKSLTEHSLEQLGRYLSKHKKDDYMTVSQWYKQYE